MWAGMMSFHALSRCTRLPAPPRVHQPGSSLDPVLRDFYGRFITQATGLYSWPLVIERNLQAVFLSQGWGLGWVGWVGLKVPTLLSRGLVPLAASRPPSMGYLGPLYKVTSLAQIQISCKGLSIIRHPFHFYTLKRFQELRTKHQILQ